MAEEAPPPSKGFLHACQRAELLGLPQPTEAEWLANDGGQADDAEQETEDDALAQELDQSDESMRRISGGLDELNTILTATQKKINKFKTVCGSLGTLLKARVQSQSNSSLNKSTSSSEQPEEQAEVGMSTGDAEEAEIDRDCDGKTCPVTAKAVDLNAKVGSHLNKLDLLMKKAENAQYSMKHQTSQMKQFFK